jgi:hypothetical protein
VEAPASRHQPVADALGSRQLRQFFFAAEDARRGFVALGLAVAGHAGQGLQAVDQSLCAGPAKTPPGTAG